eukprot:5657790-Prymnesium_polylepis.1
MLLILDFSFESGVAGALSDGLLAVGDTVGMSPAPRPCEAGEQLWRGWCRGADALARRSDARG